MHEDYQLSETHNIVRKRVYLACTGSNCLFLINLVIRVI